MLSQQKDLFQSIKVNKIVCLTGQLCSLGEIGEEGSRQQVLQRNKSGMTPMDYSDQHCLSYLCIWLLWDGEGAQFMLIKWIWGSLDLQ
jgi:hypothetical protein